VIYSIALSLLLGSELTYYLLIVQTGVVSHFHSDLITLFPMFVGGVMGTWLSGFSWFGLKTPIHKIFIALALQLYISLFYPDYNSFDLLLLGLAVGFMAPLGIYLFKAKQQKEIFFALAIAYTVGTSFFTFDADLREPMAVIFSIIGILCATVLKNYQIDMKTKTLSYPFISYLPLMFWILLDSNLFETLSRHNDINIWSNETPTIIVFHILGLIAAYFIDMSKIKQNLFIAALFIASYLFSYLELPILLSIAYPFTISYYNVVVFTTLSKEANLSRLSFMMIFVGWVASGLGLAVAISNFLH